MVINEYNYSDYILSFVSNSNITLNFSDNFKYYVDISGNDYLVDNSNIFINDNVFIFIIGFSKIP